MGSAWDDLDLTPVDGEQPRFTGRISDSWLLVAVSQGGIVAAMAARAMAETLASLGQAEHTLRSISAVFAGQVACGPVEIDVAVLRQGRSMSQLTATVRNPGASSPAWLLGHNRARYAGDGYASVDMALWDPDGAGGPTLVAYATQMMFFAFGI